eukprot:m.73309 g.73309  ORF g.73309 m.73309 type:complete len:136 (-) comp14323_c0_seq2:838-1245(-)
MTVPESRSNFIWDFLEDLEYESITEAEALDDCLVKGFTSPTFCKLVTDLANSLAEAAALSSHVSPIDVSDTSIFHIELSSLLKEYECIYSHLQQQSVFDTLETRLELVGTLSLGLVSSLHPQSLHAISCFHPHIW